MALFLATYIKPAAYAGSPATPASVHVRASSVVDAAAKLQAAKPSVTLESVCRVGVLLKQPARPLSVPSNGKNRSISKLKDRNLNAIIDKLTRGGTAAASTSVYKALVAERASRRAFCY